MIKDKNLKKLSHGEFIRKIKYNNNYYKLRSIFDSTDDNFTDEENLNETMDLTGLYTYTETFIDAYGNNASDVKNIKEWCESLAGSSMKSKIEISVGDSVFVVEDKNNTTYPSGFYNELLFLKAYENLKDNKLPHAEFKANENTFPDIEFDNGIYVDNKSTKLKGINGDSSNVTSASNKKIINLTAKLFAECNKASNESVLDYLIEHRSSFKELAGFYEISYYTINEQNNFTIEKVLFAPCIMCFNIDKTGKTLVTKNNSTDNTKNIDARLLVSPHSHEINEQTNFPQYLIDIVRMHLENNYDILNIDEKTKRNAKEFLEKIKA